MNSRRWLPQRGHYRSLERRLVRTGLFLCHPLSESFAASALAAGLYLVYSGRGVPSERRFRSQTKAQTTGAKDMMQIRTETPPRLTLGGDPNNCPRAMKAAITPGHTQLRSPTWKSYVTSPLWLTMRFAWSSHMTSSG